MYLCKVCGACSKPKQRKLIHQVLRWIKDRYFGEERQEIAAELPVCKTCKDQLEAGISLEVLRESPPAPKPAVPVRGFSASATPVKLHGSALKSRRS